jgi:peptidoglycan hydrolase CwlO-like protein
MYMMTSVILLGIMTINGLWRFGYYRIFSGKSMGDIPIGFDIEIGDRSTLPSIAHISSSISRHDDVDSCLEDTPSVTSREYSSISMRVLNPITSVKTIEIVRLESMLTQVLQAKSETESKLSKTESKLSETESKLSETESKLFETESKLSETESKLSETESKLSETESKLSQTYQSKFELEVKLNETNTMLHDCLNRLAKLES